MLRIKQIRIKNFRSIVDLDINVDKMNIFVGLNDAGKSNILKALNLFFNNETEPGCAFDFETDYSKYAPVRKKKAKEIEISIVLQYLYVIAIMRMLNGLRHGAMEECMEITAVNGILRHILKYQRY